MNGRRLGREIARAAVAARLRDDIERAAARGMVGLALIETLDALGFVAPPVPSGGGAFATGGLVTPGRSYRVGE